MEILAYWRVFKRYIGFVSLVVVLAVGSAIIVSFLRKPQYATTTTLFLNPTRAEQTLGYQDSLSLQSLANSYAEFMRTETFVDSIATISHVPLSKDTLSTVLMSRYVPDTPYFHITVTYTDPYVAQRLANAAAQALIEAHIAPVDQLQQTATTSDQQVAQQYNQELTKARREELALYDHQLSELRIQTAQFSNSSLTPEETQRRENLQEQVRTIQSARITLLQSLVESSSTSSDTQTAIRQTASIIDAAPLPQKPVSGKAVIVLTAGIVGAVLGVGVALLLDYLDTSVRVPETLAAIYAYPVLGVLGRASSAFKGQSLLLGKGPSEHHGAFDALHLALQAIHRNTGISSLLITSAVAAEGKTFVAANTALSLARSGKRVVLVDADLRKSSLQHIFNLAGAPGLTDVLYNKRDLGDVLQESGFAHLHVLTAGEPVTQPATLLDSQAMTDVLCQLTQRADVVVIDAPPLLSISDALALAPKVDAVLHVVRAGKTPVETVLRAKVALERVQANIIGVVLNGADNEAQQGAAASYKQIISAWAMSRWQRFARWRVSPEGADRKLTTYTLSHEKLIRKPSASISTDQQSRRSSKHKGRSLEHRSSKYPRA